MKLTQEISAAGARGWLPPKNIFPLLGEFAFELGRERVDRRVAVFPEIGPAGVQNGAAVGEIVGVTFLRRHRRIERGRPAVVDHGYRRLRVTARGDRPQHFAHVRGIDILVDDDDIAAVIVSRAAGEGGESRLLRVAMIALLDRDYDKRRAVARRARSSRAARRKAPRRGSPLPEEEPFLRSRSLLRRESAAPCARP